VVECLCAKQVNQLLNFEISEPIKNQAKLDNKATNHFTAMPSVHRVLHDME